jgi:hypothetical protein
LVIFFGLYPNVIGVINNKSIQISINNSNSVVDDLQGVIILCIITIENIGSTILREIDWRFNCKTENGRIIFGDGEHGRIHALEPGEKEIIILVPFLNLISSADGQSPIGFGNIIMMSTAETSAGASAEDQERVFLFGPIMLPISTNI